MSRLPPHTTKSFTLVNYNVGHHYCNHHHLLFGWERESFLFSDLNAWVVVQSLDAFVWKEFVALYFKLADSIEKVVGKKRRGYTEMLCCQITDVIEIRSNSFYLIT